MVPSWAPAPPPPDAPPPDAPPPQPETPPATPPPAPTPSPPVPTAPSGRFRGTRNSLRTYARTGDSGYLRRGVGRYVRKGYGGSGTAARRFTGTATTAAALGGALAGIASGQAAAGSPLDPALLAGRSAQEVMNAVVEAVRPMDGTQDAEAARAAIRDALSELLTVYPDADLLNLDDDQRSLTIERYTAIDVFRRFELDVGKTIVDKAPSASTALARLKEAKDYIKETISAAFRKLRDAGRTLTGARIGRVVQDALYDAFQVFEGYAE